MTVAVPVVPRGGRIVAVLAIVLVALSMRSGVAVVGPLFSEISGELHLSVIVLSLMGAAPPIFFALAGLIGPWFTRRFGLEGTLVIALVALIAGQGVRALSQDAVLLVVSTAVVVTGIGLMNVLLPPLVRRYFPDRVGLLTSLYLVLMGLAASAAAFEGVQLAQGFGWRFAIVVWAAVAVLALIPWISMLRSPRSGVIDAVVPEFDTASIPVTAVRRPVARSSTAWALAGIMALPSINIYGAMAFLPAILVQTAGLTTSEAAAAVGAAIVLGIPEALIVPLLATRARTITPMIAIAGLCALGAWIGMLTAPAAAPILWGVLIGLVPILFPLALLMVNTRSRDHGVTVALSGFVQGVGYIAAGVFALGMGVLHDTTGSWTAGMIALMLTSAIAVPAILILRRRRIVDDELAVRA
jgi:CP family cyanate transporter-like MFS transporter